MSETTPHSNTSDNSPESSSNFDFEQFLKDAEDKIETLKQRRASISNRTTDFQIAKDKVDPETLKDIEISQDIESDLEKLEYELVSELIGIVGEKNLTWKGTGEGFWVFFRYAGIGFVLAVLIHQLIQ